MAKKLSSVVGIDIGSQQIKVAEIKIQGREPAINALGIWPTPAGAADHTGVYDPDSVADAVKQVCASVGASSPAAIISIAGQASVLVRTLEVAKMSTDELKDHMSWEISRNIPFAESTVQSDYAVYPSSDAASQNMDVVMAISPQSAVDTLISIGQKSGKKLAAIDVEPLGLLRSMTVSYGEIGADTTCLVDVGHNTTSINIIKNGELVMPRQLPIGGVHFTKAIADNLGISEEDAEELKNTKANVPSTAGQAPVGGDFFAPTSNFEAFNPYGTPTPPAADPTVSMSADAPSPEPEVSEPVAAMAPVPSSDSESIRIYNAMAGVLDEFLSEIRRSIDYYKSKGGDVHSIYLCGGGSKMPGLPEFLNRMIGVPTERFDPLRGLNITAKRLDHGVLENHRQEFAVAIGNALHILF